MIGSLGGAQVLSDGSRNYPGSGGYVGGLSMVGGNWSYWTGAGQAYNKITPSGGTTMQGLVDISTMDDSDGGRVIEDSGGGAGGSGSGGGGAGGGGGIISPTYGTNGLPAWIPAGTYNSISSAGLPVSFTVSQSGQAFGNYAGTNFAGQIYQSGGLWYFLSNGLVSLINKVRGGFTSTGTWDSSQSTQFTVSDIAQNDPTVVPTQSSILDLLGGLLAPTQPTTLPTPLTQFTPTGATDSGSGFSMKNILLLGVVGVIAYFVWKKYA